jgi:pSer/pThr/pTyr-binding forkhead associated (FHA) protein
VIRTAARDLRVPQESFVLAPAHARGASAGETSAPAGRLVVVESPSLPSGRAFETGPVPLTIGRSSENEAALADDDYASAQHARVEAQRDGVWILDLGSTNGTWINGERMDGRRRLHDGDVVRVGQTELRFESGRRGSR